MLLFAEIIFMMKIYVLKIYANAKAYVLLPMNKRQKIVPRAGRDGY